MSLLFVSYNEAKKAFVTTEITRMVAKFLLETVTVPLAKKFFDEDLLIQAEVDLMDKNYSLDRFDEEQFQQAYDIIKKNSQNPILQPYAKDLLAKMETDPRLASESA